MKFKNTILSFISVVLASMLFALPAFAQTTSSGLLNPLNVSTIQDLLAEVMKTVVTLGSILLTLMLIYVGFLFVSARGNEEAITKARTALLWTIIGGLILLGASAIASVIAATAGSLTS